MELGPEPTILFAAQGLLSEIRKGVGAHEQDGHLTFQLSSWSFQSLLVNAADAAKLPKPGPDGAALMFGQIAINIGQPAPRGCGSEGHDGQETLEPAHHGVGSEAGGRTGFIALWGASSNRKVRRWRVRCCWAHLREVGVAQAAQPAFSQVAHLRRITPSSARFSPSTPSSRSTRPPTGSWRYGKHGCLCDERDGSVPQLEDARLNGRNCFQIESRSPSR